MYPRGFTGLSSTLIFIQPQSGAVCSYLFLDVVDGLTMLSCFELFVQFTVKFQTEARVY